MKENDSAAIDAHAAAEAAAKAARVASKKGKSKGKAVYIRRFFCKRLLLQAQSESNQGARWFKDSRCMRAINVARYRRELSVCF